MLRKFLLFIVLFILSTLVAGVFLLVIGQLTGLGLEDFGNFELIGQDPEKFEIPIKISVGLQHFCMFTLSAIFYALFIYKKDWIKSFSFEQIDGSLLVKFILLWCVALPAIGASAALFEYIDLPEWANTMDESSIDALMNILKMDGPLDLLFNLLIIAILPAIGEELIFRGIIQKELVGKLSNPHVAIFIASFIFSAVHLQVAGFLPKFLIGLVLGYSYYWTKSLWYPVVLHFVNNGFQTLLLYFSGDEMLENPELTEQIPSPWILLITFGISCLLCGLVAQNIKESLPEERQSESA